MNEPTMTARGRLGKDPDIRYTEKGELVTSFSIALYTGGSKAKGYNESLWVRISTFGELAESCQTLTKGQLVYVEGTPRPKKFYKNDKGVEVQADLEINASKVEITTG